jgi:hypothetical protein
MRVSGKRIQMATRDRGVWRVSSERVLQLTVAGDRSTIMAAVT